MEMNLPILIKQGNFLLLGAGKVAKQKHRVLLESGIEASIIADSIQDSYFENLKVQIKKIHADNLAETLNGFKFVIDATGDCNLGKSLFENRSKFGYLLNVVDQPLYCDFYFGALARYDSATIMVSTSGASPLLARQIRDKIARILPKNLGSLVEKLCMERKLKGAPTPQESLQIQKECQQQMGKVFIIGCGPNRLENLTLKAVETFSLLDIALVDNLVGKEIWELLETLGCTIKSVGKQKGKQSFKQEEINQLMLQYAQEGKCVGRLKGGDPAIFGRVFEEAYFLGQHGIEVEMMNGISSSLCGALSAGISPTIRGISSGVLIVSAHLRENIFHCDWLKHLCNQQYTIIVMMVYSFAERIVQEAQKMGINMEIPAAFVSQIDMPEQKIVIGTLGQLKEMADSCKQPAILILGDVVKISKTMPFQGEKIQF